MSRDHTLEMLNAATALVDCFEPCGPSCPCWNDANAPIPGPRWGWCRQDDPETTSAMKVGEFAAWKIAMQEEMP